MGGAGGGGKLMSSLDGASSNWLHTCLHRVVENNSY